MNLDAHILLTDGGLVDMGGWPGYTGFFAGSRSPWHVLPRQKCPKPPLSPLPARSPASASGCTWSSRPCRPPSAGDSTLVKLSCVDDDAQGQRLEVLWEREIDPEIQTGEAWDAIAKRGFDPARIFAAYLNTLRWNCVTATDPQLFQSPFRAGIQLDAYQLEPLRKALLLPRVNLFIADDVGLGKTIEALLIGRELLIRKKVREIVICCPPSMLYQWQDGSRRTASG